MGIREKLKLCDTILADIKKLNDNKKVTKSQRKILKEERLKTQKIKEQLIKLQDSIPGGYIYGIGDNTLQEIADYMGITRERVRQIEASGIKKLKHPKIGRILKLYKELR